MPNGADVYRMLSGQAFGDTHVPKLDLSGKTFVVTGANTGLGLEAAKHLARLEASRLILGCRNSTKGEKAKACIISDTNCADRTSIEVWDIDQDHYSSVIAFAQRVRSQLDRLDGFIANAGVELLDFELSEGLERTLTINVVSTFLVALAVLPELQETASRYGNDTRLTLVGSIIHVFAPDRELEVSQGQDILESLSDPKTANMPARYNLSKLMVHQLFVELIRRAPAPSGKHRAIINLVNSGWCGTELSRNKEMAAFERMSFSLIGWTGEKGSRTLVHAVTAGPETHGQYLSQCQVSPQGSYMRSQRGNQIGKRLWEDTMQRIMKTDPEAAEYVS